MVWSSGASRWPLETDSHSNYVDFQKGSKREPTKQIIPFHLRLFSFQRESIVSSSGIASSSVWIIGRNYAVRFKDFSAGLRVKSSYEHSLQRCLFINKFRTTRGVFGRKNFFKNLL